MIGDDGQRLDGRARQPLLFGLLFAQQEGQIRRRSELPFSSDTDKGYTTGFIDALKLGEDRLGVGPFGQRGRQRLHIERLGRGEKQGLGHAQMLGIDALFGHGAIIGGLRLGIGIGLALGFGRGIGLGHGLGLGNGNFGIDFGQTNDLVHDIASIADGCARSFT